MISERDPRKPRQWGDGPYDDGYDNGYEDGFKEGHTELANDICNRPGCAFALMNTAEWQDWFDRLKAEAARLGARV